jgi:hypothetical protein
MNELMITNKLYANWHSFLNSSMTPPVKTTRHMSYYLHFYLNGIHYAVTLTEIIHPIHTMYLAEFDDEYENIFYSDPCTGKWIEQDLGFTPLAAMISQHLERMSVPVRKSPKNIIWHHQYNHGQWLHFGYYPFCNDGNISYEIYASNHRFMFHLMKTPGGDWQVLQDTGSGWNFNDSYAEHILRVIEQLYQDSM